jgi:CBS domain-containing protein
MDDIFVARIMSTDLETVTPDTLVEEAASLMLDNDIGSVMVVDDEGHLEGILTTTDFVDIVAQSHPKAETAVSRYMSTELITASAQDAIREVADMMITYGIHHVPIVDDTEGLIGIVTTSDLAAYLADVDIPTTA